jgi:archaellum component FlaC
MIGNELRDWLQERLDRIDDRMGSMSTTLTEQAVDIKHHIKRTDLLEQRVEQVAESIKPIQEHVARIRSVGWFLAGLTAMVGTVLGVIEALNKLVG